jgi:DNA-binding transcriptional MerR regulator
MKWSVPGTTLSILREEADSLEQTLSALFLAGGISLGQVAGITGLEPYTVQNWVKRGFLPPPEQKKYSLRQLCRILNINMLRPALPLEKICSLMGYVNGRLDDTSDDIIDDARLYFLFVRLAARARELDAPNRWGQAMAEALAGYEEPVPGARARVEKALQIMMTAWVAARMQQEAERLLQQAEMETNQEKEKK